MCPDVTWTTPLGDVRDLFDSLLADNPLHDVSDKNRVPALEQRHEEITGSCLVYRFMISRGSGLQDPTRSLSLTQGRNIMASQPRSSISRAVQELITIFINIPATLPFAVRFQLQKFAQNGYLALLKAVDLLSEVRRMFSRSGNRVRVNAIPRLFRPVHTQDQIRDKVLWPSSSNSFAQTNYIRVDAWSALLQ